MPEERDLYEMLLRLRWRQDAIDEWRRNVVDPALERLRDGLDGLAKKDEIETAMRNAVRSQHNADRTLRLSLWQRVGAVAGGILLVYNSIGAPH